MSAMLRKWGPSRFVCSLRLRLHRGIIMTELRVCGARLRVRAVEFGIGSDPRTPGVASSRIALLAMQLPDSELMLMLGCRPAASRCLLHLLRLRLPIRDARCSLRAAHGCHIIPLVS